MNALLLYLLKANVALLLFAVVYYGLLRRLTFFRLNRACLLLALGFAAVYPALPVPALWVRAAAPATPAQPMMAAVASTAGPLAALPIDWPALLLQAYAAGTAVLLVRLMVQLLALARLHRRSRPARTAAGEPYRELPTPDGPFSFGTTIYLNPAPPPANAAERAAQAAVLRHEQAHVRQAHTVDVLLAHLATALAWPNPAAWLLRRALLDNLKYLADHAALASGLDRRTYQYTLLRQHPAGAGLALASSFSFHTLKNRVVMMNTLPSTAGQKARYLIAGPLLVASALAFSATQAQPQAVMAAPSDFATTPQSIYYIDGQLATKAAADALDPKTIVSMQVLNGATARQLFHEAEAGGMVVITTTANQHLPAVMALNEKLARVVPVGTATQTESPAPISALPPAALAYITQHYPGYRLADVTEIKLTNSPVRRYKAGIVKGRRPEYVTFDAAGQVVK